MVQEKIFIGTKLRSLRQDRGLNQSAFAHQLGVSPSLVNLLERNQRSASLSVLLRISDMFGIELGELTQSATPISLQDLRKILAHPSANQPDVHIDELRGALEIAPRVVEGLKALHSNYEILRQRVEERDANDGGSVQASEQRVHEFINQNKNHFPLIEEAAENFRRQISMSNFSAFEDLSKALREREGILVQVRPHEDMYPSVRLFDKMTKTLALSDTLDHTNKVFQLAQFIGLVHFESSIEKSLFGGAFPGHQDKTRAQTMLCDYFAAAVLMPYDAFLAAAVKWKYDFERLSAYFSVSFEQVCQRATSLHRPGHKGVPFFFLRVDKAGNVSKRFNSASISLARNGGTCPRLNVHYSFRVPGRILTQRVEMPDGEQLITINRTVSRPSSAYNQDDRRQAVCVGCAIRYESDIVYAASSQLGSHDEPTQIGLNCRLCPRPACNQRAHESVVQELPVAAYRRGQNRFDN